MRPGFDRLALTARRAVVSGGGSDIGRAIAALLAERGAQVFVADIARSSAEASARAIEAAGGGAIALGCDVADEASVIEMARAVHQDGPATLLVNVAAINAPEQTNNDTSVADMDVAVWDRAFAVNVRGAMLTAKHFLPAMIEAGGGAIVNISSTAALLSLGTVPAYSASKTAMHSLSLSIATAYGPAGVRCNTVAPGFVDTATTRRMGEDFFAMTRAHNALPRLGAPTDIAETVAFLLSDAAGYITGQMIAVDGGQTSHLPIVDTLRRVTAGTIHADDETARR